MGSLAERFDRTWLMTRKKALLTLAPRRGPAATQLKVFVAGMQRSGTNMMMDVLERSFQTDVYHERDPRAFDNYVMREPTVIRELIKRSRAPYFVIKALCELQDLPALMHTFEPAKTLWIVRHYNDVVNSMLVSFRNMAKQVQRIARDRSSGGWLSRGMSDETHALVRRFGHLNISDASASALQWYFRNILFFEQHFDRNPHILLVGYERLVTDPLSEFQRMFAFLGLEFSPRVARHVSPRSIHRRPSPAIEAPVRELCDGLWERFQERLERNL